MKKLMATVAAGALMITLAGCGNSSSSTKDNSSNDASSSKVVKSAKTSGKTAATSTNQSKKASEKSVSSSAVTSSSSSNVTSSSKSTTATSTSEQSTREQMTAQDAKNIVKEHIGNQLNNAGISGKPATGLPSIDEVDGYTAVQNGINDWTVSGNGHSFHVTATSVTGK
ncbi:MAG: hypothetical protein LKJ51_04085 [Limosilactobacillus sp.]|uniref:hypothetical protein n=1 Tax=Limosilactobacillus TaxID=2742598 RepID=UPI0022A9D033|nr:MULTISPECIES: hypothetical protein [Limosilactobacillus]MCI1975086.1 hypothetical protein [Limosilactobacillus sp.]MCI2031330.1 hypothetical protein [Limosilactobacillus sp.]MCI6852684.1 hypothetical protein [Limosilactobacillus vaginalis]MCZ2466021.1 hypothetical protein [Limosilactobacillus vaginalis]MDY4864445.1 hypothetical protein [Limosilactobacillus sp.]